MKYSLSQETVTENLAKLRSANLMLNKHFPGEGFARQPVHTVYGGAHLFKTDSVARLGELALRSLDEYGPDFAKFARALQLPGSQRLPVKQSDIDRLSSVLRSGVRSSDQDMSFALMHDIYDRVKEKLRRQPVEDFRIDFEDGYGNRSDGDEDCDADRTALEVARGMADRKLPPFIGIRIKPFTEELKVRSVRTLDIFLTRLLERTQGVLPENFVVTLPKVTIPEQVACLAELLEQIETVNGLGRGSLKLELMIETTQSIINHRGEMALPDLIAASNERCVALHFGTYDYTASLNITALHQSMDHPACDFARNIMKVAVAGTPMWLSDGATNIMPVGPHRGRTAALTQEQRQENEEVVHHAWRLSFSHIAHSLLNGFYQGWDLHPAQLPVRYAACYFFFLKGLEPASIRLRSFMDKAAQASLVGDVFDDAATGQGLLNYFLRALNCGAITEEEIKCCGLTLDELRSRSFAKILAQRSMLPKVVA